MTKYFSSAAVTLTPAEGAKQVRTRNKDWKRKRGARSLCESPDL